MINKGMALVVALGVSSSAVSNAQSAPVNAPNTLTHGMVQMYVKVGQTTQYEILGTFGGPNVSTIDGSGNEVWIYDRHATVSYNQNSGFSIGMGIGAGGGGVGGLGGIGYGKSKNKSEQSSRTMTLILKFGPDKKVVDFQSRSSSF